MFKGKLFSVALLVMTAFALFLGFSQLQNSSSVHAARQVDKFDDLENFSQVINLIKNNYVEDVSDSVLMQGAIKGMLLELDPHSSYFTPEQYRSFMTEMKGEFGGLGMTVGMRDGLVTVISPIEDTPAFYAGIKAGDIIMNIDGQSTAGMSTDEAVELMRGKPKTSVKLTIARKGENKPLEFTITRDIIKLKSVKYQMISGDIGYVRFTNFQENSSAEVRAALADLQQQGAQSTVLDLRNNPGGSLTEAVKVASLFLQNNKPVVITKNRNGKEQVLSSKSSSYRDTDRPLIILMNEGSASASEIVAGAIQDYGRGTIMGTTSFGKASVQTLFDLRNGGAVKLTTAKYYTPENRSIQGVGIIPDVNVEYVVPENGAAHPVSIPGEVVDTGIDVNSDSQLKAAVDYLRNMAVSGK